MFAAEADVALSDGGSGGAGFCVYKLSGRLNLGTLNIYYSSFYLIFRELTLGIGDASVSLWEDGPRANEFLSNDLRDRNKGGL